MSEKFNPQEYMTYIKDKPYLKPAHRVLWFKLENGHDGAITTELVQFEPFPIVKAYVHLKGEIIASAYGTAQVKQGTVYFGREVEKAETAAIGRALSYAGYGTQFSEDDDDEDLADSPIGKSRQNRATTSPNGNNPPQQPQNANLPPSGAKNGQTNGNGMDKDTARQKAIKMLMAAGVDPNAAIKIEPPPNPPTSSNNLDWATRMIERAKAAS